METLLSFVLFFLTKYLRYLRACSCGNLKLTLTLASFLRNQKKAEIMHGYSILTHTCNIDVAVYKRLVPTQELQS